MGRSPLRYPTVYSGDILTLSCRPLDGKFANFSTSPLCGVIYSLERFSDCTKKIDLVLNIRG